MCKMTTRNSMQSDVEKDAIEDLKPTLDAEISNAATIPLPTGWMYKRSRIGPVEIPHYASPISQLLLVSITFFL